MDKKYDGWFLYSRKVYNNKIEKCNDIKMMEYAKEKGLDIKILCAQDFVIETGEKNKIYYQGKEVINLPKFVVMRRYDIYLSRQFEMLGVRVINKSQAMIDARNKLKTYQILAEKGIPIPKTFYQVTRRTSQEITYEEASKYLGSNKFIMKWVFGSQGSAVFLVEDKEHFDEIINKYEGICMLQEFIETSFGRDIRAYVLGGRYVGAAIRKSQGDFRSNLALGGDALNFEYDEKVAHLAEEAAKALDLDIAGVDILFGKDGYIVCEVNALPGFKSLYRTTGLKGTELIIDMAKEIIERENL
ncbi:MAG TPA: RimK family alpha-L-glutamate ligase [Tenericutes bacterium]|nr:RimK family alpha-L-glutamate ligase [Mycoplasmatota bacterium]